MGKPVTKTCKNGETYKCASSCSIFVNGGEKIHYVWALFCFVTILLSVKTSEGDPCVFEYQFWSQVYTQSFFFFPPMYPKPCPCHQRNWWAKLGLSVYLCYKFQRSPALSRILKSLLEYGILLPWISVTGSICLYLMEIIKGLPNKTERLTYQVAKEAALVDKPFKTNVITL